MSRIIQVYDEEKQINVQVSPFWYTMDVKGFTGLTTNPYIVNPLNGVFLHYFFLSLHHLPPPLPINTPPPLQADSEVAEAGKAVSLYFEERLKELFPDRTFPPMPEGEQCPREEDEDVTEDSDDDFVQPKRKRLKTEKPMHIKWSVPCPSRERSWRKSLTQPSSLSDWEGGPDSVSICLTDFFLYNVL